MSPVSSKNFAPALGAAALLAALSLLATVADASRHDDHRNDDHHDGSGNMNIQLGPRPFFLVNDMEDSALKNRLMHCGDGPFRKSDFSIGHRGAALQFPEHTKEAYEAGARMGAGGLFSLVGAPYRRAGATRAAGHGRTGGGAAADLVRAALDKRSAQLAGRGGN